VADAEQSLNVADDCRHMARALQLARRGLYTTDPNPRVGCVIVRDREVVGEGWHERAGGPHAEVHALRAAGERARGATVYVTLEPCSHHGRTPPCADALIDAGVDRVVAAMADPNPQVATAGVARLREAGIAVELGVMEAQAEALNPGFLSRMRRGRPWVRAKLAASLDGRTAMASGESKWITGEAARDDVQRWRARSSAILTGIGTVLADDPRLDVRLPGADRQPMRVVVDSNLSMPTTARMLAVGGPVMVVTANDDSGYAESLAGAGAEVMFLPAGQRTVDLVGLMDQLASREINEVHLEAGANLCGAMLVAGLVDEIVLYLAPHLMGSQARGLFNLPGLERLADRVALRLTDVRNVGDDLRVVARVIEPAGKLSA
jgi:diaminohydroxyphosphoribosylaminopyrimidine deaminase/5-amino-6-(5-phosphoribosylamino)uracil reductase